MKITGFDSLIWNSGISSKIIVVIHGKMPVNLHILYVKLIYYYLPKN